MAYTEIGSIGELRDLLGVPTGRAVTKERTSLHAADRQWLAISPFCILATSDARGNCDASPKGDPAGHLVHVLDETTVAIAERPGNRRADGYGNILANPHVGIISMIPGRNETLRINGRARLLRDAPFFDELTVRGRRPILALLVEVEQIFFHCPKAFMRSQLWQPADVAPGCPALTRGPGQGRAGDPGDAGRAGGPLRPGALFAAALSNSRQAREVGDCCLPRSECSVPPPAVEDLSRIGSRSVNEMLLIGEGADERVDKGSGRGAGHGDELAGHGGALAVGVVDLLQVPLVVGPSYQTSCRFPLPSR